jgi:hypothetical protein
VLRTHLLMVWRMSVGDSPGEVAEMVGYSKKWTKERSKGVTSAEVLRHSAIVATPIRAPSRGLCWRRPERQSS